ncbi:MAG: hypothetical protein JNM17_38670 [Archangium sp.]|nr:hypothetical protein [Archangium sp.]
MAIDGLRSAPSLQTMLTPLDGDALGLGDFGPAVSQLQEALNALGAGLEVDGQLGPKTQASMLELLGSATLTETAQEKLSSLSAKSPTGGMASDGFDAPPPAGPSLSTANVNETAATAAPSGAGGMSSRVVDNALAENDSINPMKVGDDGKPKGWKQLQQIFTDTTGTTPSDAECQKIEPGKGIKPNGASWCGIWACHILQKSGCDVKWDGVKGGMVGDVTHTSAPKFKTPSSYKAERQAFEQSIRPGDVVTLAGPQNHHAIVTKVNDDGTFETMDGNKPHVGPGHQKLADVTGFYRPNGD